MDTLFGHKQYLRSKILDELAKVPQKKFAEAGEIVAKHLEPWFELTFSNHADIHIGLFFSFKNEISTFYLNEFLKRKKIKCFFPGLIRESKMPHFFPVNEKEELIIKKSDGIYLPKVSLEGMQILEKMTVVFVPGLLFDKRGNRLGRGQGYYDRYFSSLKGLEKPVKIALAMDEQLIERVPTESHDIKMDFLCTPNTGIINIEE